MTSKRSWKGYNPVPRSAGGPQGGVLGNMAPPSQGIVKPGQTRPAPRKTDGVGGGFSNTAAVVQPLPVQLGAILWFDGTQGKTLNVNAVDAWDDQVASVTLEDVETGQPNNVATGVEFGGSDRLESTSIGSLLNCLHDGTGGTIWFRISSSSAAQERWFGTTLSGVGIYGERFASGTVRYYIRNATGNIATPTRSSTFTALDTAIDTGIIVGATSASTFLGPTIDTAVNYTDTVAATNPTGIALGSVPAATSLDWDGTIFQCIVFDYELTAVELAQLEAWTP
jgi:hypothetical protein